VGEGLETLRRRLPLLDYLEQHNWKGRPAGRWEYVGLCPLHEENRPSFYVNTRKEVFYCHGCGRGGDLKHIVNLYGRSIGSAFAHRFLPGSKGGLYAWEKVRNCSEVILVEGLLCRTAAGGIPARRHCS
jgi:hypothetical protein